MLRERILKAMAELQLNGMRSAFDELSAISHKRRDNAEKFLLSLLEAEQTEREVRSMRYRLGQARFPVMKELESFDFSASPVHRATVEALYQGEFVQSATNVVLVGGSGTGKTHLATAIGMHLLRLKKRVRFFNVVDLVNQLEQERQSVKIQRLARHLQGFDCVILDELGYLPFSRNGFIRLMRTWQEQKAFAQAHLRK